MATCQNFSFVYKQLLTELYHRGLWEINARTGVGVRMLRGGFSFKLDLANGYLPLPGNRAYFPRVAAAEVAWQFLGTQDPSFILEYAPKMWSKFVESEKVDDDPRNNRRVLKTAYGYRWKKHFGRDQLAMACDQLMNNPTNRQLYLSAWDPAADGLGGPDQPKNIPCPVGFSLTRTEDEVHASVFLRSSDVFVGLPYDVMGYALTLDAIAMSVQLRPGTLHFTLAHPHYYDPHAQAVEDCVMGKQEWISRHEPVLPRWRIEEVEADPDRYVGFVTRLAKQVKRHDWNPMPEVIE